MFLSLFEMFQMIFEGSCDTEDWSIDTALPSQEYIYIYIYI